MFSATDADTPLEVPRSLPRGLNSLPREVVLLSQRSRLIEATAHCVGTKGYLSTTVADIISRAGVSRTTFYQQFKDKEDCYFYCYDRLSQSHLERTLAALGAGTTPKMRLIGSIDAYLQHLADNGEYALAFFAEAANAGERVQTRAAELKAAHKAHLIQWHEEVRQLYPDAIVPPATVYDLILEGSHAILERWVRGGFPQSLQDIHQAICYFCFASLGLQQWAEEVLDAGHSES
jgi:AcrR family transcriptional regulator